MIGLYFLFPPHSIFWSVLNGIKLVRASLLLSPYLAFASKPNFCIIFFSFYINSGHHITPDVFNTIFFFFFTQMAFNITADTHPCNSTRESVTAKKQFINNPASLEWQKKREKKSRSKPTDSIYSTRAFWTAL